MQTYSEEKLLKIQRDIESKMEQEDDFLQEIEKLSGSIAKRLMDHPHVRERFMDTEYIFSLSYDETTKELVLFRTDPVKFAIAGSKYRPAIIRAERDNDFSYYENVYALVKAALCSKAGRIEVEEQD